MRRISQQSVIICHVFKGFSIIGNEIYLKHLNKGEFSKNNEKSI